MTKQSNNPEERGVAPARRRYRSGERTRERLLQATIRCLHKIGYGGTSIESVLTEAGTSRGSLLNQFSNRVDLMSSAADKSLSNMISSTRSKLEIISDPVERIVHHFDISWDAHRSPEAIALTEILLASHWDVELARAITPAIEGRELELNDMLEWMAISAGMEDLNRYVLLGRLLNSNLRGLTIELMFDPDRKMIHQCLRELRTDYEVKWRGLLRHRR